MARSAHSGGGISARAVETVVAVVIALLGALVVFDSLRLGARWAADGPQAGYFPFYVGAILCLCGAALLAAAILPHRAPSPVFVTWVALRRVFSVLAPAVIYVGGIQLVGLYLASALYIAFFMARLGRYTLPAAAATGAGVMAVFFLLFEVWFTVPLYKGLFDPLAFLGY